MNLSNLVNTKWLYNKREYAEPTQAADFAHLMDIIIEHKINIEMDEWQHTSICE